MKKYLLILGVLALVSGLIFSSCAQPAPAPKPAPAPAPTTTSPPVSPASSPTAISKPATEKPIELKFASISSPTHILNTGVHEPWIKKIEQETQGKVKITLYPAGALGKAPEAYDLAVKNIADISYGWIGYYPGRFKLTEVYMLPGAAADQKSAYNIWDVYNKYLKTEWTESKVLWLGVAMRYDLFTSNKQIKTCDDVKGMKISIQSEMGAEAIKALAGTPVEVSAQESYLAVQRGVVDGILNPWSSIAANKQGEVTKYFTRAGLIQSVWFCVMNLKTYNSLPSDIKKVIDENSNQKMWQTAIDAYWNEDVAAEAKVMQQSGGKGVIHQLPTDELAKYRKLVAPVYDKWVTETTNKGLPAKDALNMVQSYLPK